MGKYVGLGLWWLFLAVATMIVETVIGGIPLWVMVLVAVALASAALPLMFWGEVKVWRAGNVFDLPVLHALDHILATTPHSFDSWESGAEFLRRTP